MDIYFIGGSPCSGKSTIAEIITERFGFQYYKLDNFLEQLMMRATQASKPICKAFSEYTSDQIWLRTPEIQMEDEIVIYQEIFEYAMSDLLSLNDSIPVIAEGAGFLPELIHEVGVSIDRYICIVPKPTFQLEKYALRSYVSQVLVECSDKKTAYNNWMKRDCLFAEYAARTAAELGYPVIWTDKSIASDMQYQTVISLFDL